MNACSGNTYNSGIVSERGNTNSLENDCSKTGNDQSSRNQSSTFGNKSSRPRNECSERSNSGNYTNIRPYYDTEPMVEVPNTADYNVYAIEKQHNEQLEFINDTYMMEKNDSNVTSDSLDMSHNVSKVDQHATEPKDERSACTSKIAEDLETCTCFHHEFISMEHEHEVLNLDSTGTRLQRYHLYLKINASYKQQIQFKRISLTGFPAQSVRSSNVIALDSLYLLVLITGVSQSKQHVDTSLIHIESRKPPTKSLFDVDSSRISIVIVNTKERHSDVLAVSQG
ncbi:hypothetical protein Tco_0025882 [Tanacetum coccineum]